MKKYQDLEKIYKNLGDLNSDFRNLNLYNLISSKAEGLSLLDIGCGVGHFINLIKKRGIKSYGIEPDENLVKLGEKIYGKSLNIKKNSIEDINKYKLKFDNVTLIDVLEHIEDDSLALKRIKKLINKSGKLIIFVPAFKFLYCKRDKNIGHFRRYSSENLEKILIDNNYEIIELRHWNFIGFFSYILFNKLLNKDITMKIRKKGKKNVLEKILNRFLFLWMKHIENKINFGIGLSLLCVARPIVNKDR